MRRLVLSLVLLSATLLAQSVSAQAQVVVDPDSPAGKEYAIPLDEARDNGNDSSGGSGNGGGQESFGEGISRPDEEAKESSSKGKGSKDRKKKDGGNERADASDTLDTAGSIGGGGGSGGGPDEAGANGALLTSGIALAVLLLGGGIAFLMRRGAFGTDA